MSAMPNFTSVLNQLQHERIRLASQLESLNDAISALNGARSSSTRKMGETQRERGCFHPCPQRTHDVPSRPEKDCGCTESTLGKVAEGTKEGLTMQFDLKPCRHQRKRPSGRVTDLEDVSCLLFECIPRRMWNRPEARFRARDRRRVCGPAWSEVRVHASTSC